MRRSPFCVRRSHASRIPVPRQLPVLLLLGLALLAAPPPSAAVTIDWVPVGNPGNGPDTATNCRGASCGSVSDDYYIAKYETTNAQYAEFLNAKAASDPLGLWNSSMGSDATNGGITRSGISGSFNYTVKSGFADKPVVYVSFYDALRFANWLHNDQGSGDTETGAYTLLGGTAIPSNGLTVTRNVGAITFLTSENEWYKAAYFDGTSYFDYPAGTDTQTVCAAPTATANSANCNLAVGAVTNVGAYAGSAGPYGTYDQGGNVWEWNEQIVSGSLRGRRGGSWLNPAGLIAASYPGNVFAPADEYDYLGFRVASLVPEPGTGLLVMGGLLGLAARRRRPAKAF